METLPAINTISTIHMALLAFWGGVVATESVLELYPFRRRELHRHTIQFHFWIDLIVELPLVIGVIATGTILVMLAWPLSAIHIIKIICAAVAVTANLACIVLVFRRKKSMDTGADDATLWNTTRRIVLCAKVGMPVAVVAVVLGFWLGHQRMLELLL